MEYITVIADVATAVTLFVALFKLYDSIKKYNDDILHDKRKDTLDAYSRLQNEVFDNLFLEYTRADIADIAKHYKSRNDDYLKLSVYLAKIEHFCVGVVTKIYDIDTVYALAHGFFDRKVRDAIEPLIDRKDSFYGGDSFENIRAVYQMMDDMTKGKKN
ncbi:MAG: hypothetical protein MRZ77_04725 [Clostridiales bacterium]|nr:hypothetical protein [Clostridiales bacterium]